MATELVHAPPTLADVLAIEKALYDAVDRVREAADAVKQRREYDDPAEPWPVHPETVCAFAEILAFSEQLAEELQKACGEIRSSMYSLASFRAEFAEQKAGS